MGVPPSDDSTRPPPIDLRDLPVDFRPIMLKERTRRGWSRPGRAEFPVKAVRFQTPEERELARLIEAKRQLEGGRMNDLLLRLLRRGLQAESGHG